MALNSNYDGSTTFWRNPNNENSEVGQSVMITGGTGLVGRYLTPALLAKGYQVSHLSRKPGGFGKVRVFSWDPSHGFIDPEALNGIDYLIHLSGANIGEKRWSASRKTEIISSRIDSADLLYRTVTENKYKLKAFISASAVGYYGSVTSERIFTEDDEPAVDFLANTCSLWEEAAFRFEAIGIRTVCLRTAVVLEKNDSALSRLLAPAKVGLVVRTGSGTQYFPWIHIDDLCNIYLKAVMDESMRGAYNAVAPEHISHDEFVRKMAKVMKRPVFLPSVPAWVLKTALGEMAGIILNGSRVSSEKIINSGYGFLFPETDGALINILGS
jgi:uncharacterized protein (TIGR01777 family)